ncbi:MAG: diadenylate cyclase [Chloroflexota bacterium]|nr:diadenylate cyclase [Chloroflexota bacterium]MDE2894552.1 diadenylate cyclase [Chloroflexota bacterium]
MDALINDIEVAFGGFSWTNALEVTAIAVVFYAALRLLRGTTAMSVIRGMVLVVVAITVIGRVADSVVLNWIVDNALAVLLIVVLLVFQPEFRRAFEHVGRAGGLRHWGSRRQPYRAMIPMAATAAHRLSEQRVGGLFVFERDTGLEELAEDGVRLGAEPTTELLESIFWPGSPLHDGAVLLRPSEVVAAAVILPTPSADFAARGLSSSQYGGHLGTRHRAALRITEETDAIAVVISEETGTISLAAGGLLSPPLSTAELETSLSRHLHSRRWGDRLGVRIPGKTSEGHSGRPSTAGGDATGS